MAILERLRAMLAPWRGGDPATRADGGGRDATATERAGIWGEGKAEEYLRGKGYGILGRRVKLRRDEIDLVATCRVQGAEMVVFVEVKTRASDAFGGGKAALDRRKRHALCRAAAMYMRTLPKRPFRFDLVEVVGSPDSGRPPEMRHYTNAFPMDLRYVHGGLHRHDAR